MSLENKSRVSRRARAVLDRLLESRQLSDGGLDWLITATDPFHDTATTPSGFPDTNTCHSIPQCFTYTQNVSKDGALPAGTWDAHVFLAPYSSNHVGGTADYSLKPCFYSPYNGEITVAANRPVMTSGYNIIQTTPGTDWSTGSGTSVNTTNGISIPLMGGLFRLVSCGVEVVNTTPELYRGGSVTSYRSPSIYNSQSKSLWYSTYGRISTQSFSLPPTTQAQAQLYPSSRTWAAEEGGYAIGTLVTTDVPYNLTMPSMLLGTTPAPVSAILNPSAVVTSWSNVLYLTNTGTSPMGQVLPFDTHGMIFSGLTEQTTLQVTTKYYVERIPTISEPDLLVLSRKPPTYDPIALEIYTRALAELPVCVMVKDNPLGEWFDDVLQTIAEMAPLVGSSLGPMGSAAGAALSRGANHWMNTRRGTQLPPPLPPRQNPQAPGASKKKKKRKRNPQPRKAAPAQPQPMGPRKKQ